MRYPPKWSVHLKRPAKTLFSTPFYMTSSLRKLPDFIVIGAQKAGTTSLYSYITQHPQVRGSLFKEVHFFDHHYHKGEMWYRAHFPLSSRMRDDFISGEASPYYLAHPHVPRRIYELIPSVKLIAILRNPVDRAISHYYHEVRKGTESLPIMDALLAEEARIRGEWEKMLKDSTYQSRIYQDYSYKQRGIYIDQLERYFEYFDDEQILLMDSDELFQQPRRALEKVFSFLGIDPHLGPTDTTPKNVNRLNKNVPSEVYGYLNEYFRDHNRRLCERIGSTSNPLFRQWNDV